MKKIILLLAGMFTCALTYSQGTQISGSPIYYLNNYVGIGTANPGFPLEIASSSGGVDFSARLTSNRLEFNRSNNLPSYFDKSDSGPFTFRMGSSTTSRMTLTTDGNLGLGTTSPLQRLSVVGQDVSFLSNTSTNKMILGRNNNELLSVEVQDNHTFIDLIQDSDNNSNHIMHFRNLAEGTSPNNDIRFSTGNHARLSIKTNGDIGIGTSSPEYGLDINKRLMRIMGSIPALLIEDTNDPGNQWGLFAGSPSLGAFKIRGNGADRLVINSNGNIGIGTTSPTEKLQVEGNILTNGEIYSTRVRVSQNPGNWPDYVFESGYDLTSLEEVESFINNNKHLPEVPSAKTVEKEGLDLGNMDATLLKKIEELTLHLIELNKTVKAQGKEIEQLKNENKALKKARD